MKKTISALLICSLLALSLAGCSGNSKEPSSAESAASQSSVQQTSEEASNTSETTESTQSPVAESSVKSEQPSSENAESTASKEESSEGQGPEDGDLVIDESGNEIVLNEDELSDFLIELEEGSMEFTSDGLEQAEEHPTVSYNPVNIKDSNADTKSIDMSSPQFYVLTNEQELNDFMTKYDKQYSLSQSDSGITFKEYVETLDDNYFEFSTLIAIPAKYDKDSEPDIGMITVDDNNYTVEVYVQKPASEAQTDCVCFALNAYKSDLGDRKVVLDIMTENMFVDEGEGDV